MDVTWFKLCIHFQECGCSLIYSLFCCPSPPPPPPALLREAWLETKYPSIAQCHSVFTKPHPHLSDPIKSEIFIAIQCPRIPFHNEKCHIREAKCAPTAVSCDFKPCYNPPHFQSKLSQHTDPAIPKHRARRNSPL